VLLADVDEMISAHASRETTLPKEPAGSKKKEKKARTQ
jgi:hypothetical protein